MRLFNTFKAGLLAAFMAFGASQACAALVVANTTADLSSADVSLPYGVWAGAYFAVDGTPAANAIPSFTPIALSNGESFEINISFLPGHQLQVGNLSSLWPILRANDSNYDALTIFGSRVELLGADGSVIASAARGEYFTSGIDIGVPFYDYEFDHASSLLISGVRYSGDVFFGTVSPRNYHAVGLAFTGSELSVITQEPSIPEVGAVPEPSSLALLATGLMAVGVATRRKQAP